MSKFKVDNEQIEATVETLKSLLTQCEELYEKEVPVSDVDKGKTHEELITVCENIRTTCYDFGQLIHNTIEFLGESSEMFAQSDKISAEAIAIGATVAQTVLTTRHIPRKTATIGASVKKVISNIPEDAKSAGEALSWIEKQYEKAPEWLTHAIDVCVPSSLQDAYTLTSGLLQGDLTLEDGWDVVSSVLKKNTKLAVVVETINYTFETGMARSDEMEKEIYSQIEQGDILGAGFDMAEGFIDTIIGGSIDVLGDVGGGLVDGVIDEIPVVKGINMLTEYGTGLLGWNDGDGYSIGGLIGHSTEKVSEGLDFVTDIITDTTDVVTDAVTDGVKSGINWVKSWFD